MSGINPIKPHRQFGKTNSANPNNENFENFKHKKKYNYKNNKNKKYHKYNNKTYHPFAKSNDNFNSYNTFNQVNQVNQNNQANQANQANQNNLPQEYLLFFDVNDPSNFYFYPSGQNQNSSKLLTNQPENNNMHNLFYNNNNFNLPNQFNQQNLSNLPNLPNLLNPPNPELNFSQNSNPEQFNFTDEFERNFINMLANELGLKVRAENKLLLEGNMFDDSSAIQNTPIKQKEYKWIELGDISTLDDLIKIGNKWGTELSDQYEYNVNIKLINDLIPELEELNKMIGLKVVKSQIIDMIMYWALGLENKNQDLLHTVIEGEPGTGKTELAEKLAKIYLKMGILKNNTFKKVKRADLIAGYLGQTAIKTASVLEECKGGVLFIDEAYSLGNPDGKDGKDSFSKECIDTLNQHLTEAKSDFVCIIAGYADDLAKSFFSYNSGLERRFPIRFSICPYTDEELGKIFIKKIKEYEWDIGVESNELNSTIKLNRKYFKFNGGDMEVLFAKCKISHSKNLLRCENKVKKVIDKKDLEDGIKLFLLNPQVKKREEEFDYKQRISHIYV